MKGKEGERIYPLPQPIIPSSVDISSNVTQGVESLQEHQQPDTAHEPFAPKQDVYTRRRQRQGSDALPIQEHVTAVERPISAEVAVVQISAARYQELIVAEQTLQRIRQQQRNATKRWKAHHPKEHKEQDRQWAKRHRDDKPLSDSSK